MIDKNFFKDILRIPSKSREEYLMIDFIKSQLRTRGLSYYVDDVGNILCTKGSSNKYTLLVCHTDTVHDLDHSLEVREFIELGDVCFTGYNKNNNKDSGIGGDNKCGIYMVLSILDSMENVKCCFFVQEEIGCLGVKNIIEDSFFKDIDLCIEFDSPGFTTSYQLRGCRLYNNQSTDILFEKYGIFKKSHSCTDVYYLMDRYGMECYNLPAGYYNQHHPNEWIKLKDMEISLDLASKIILHK